MCNHLFKAPVSPHCVTKPWLSSQDVNLRNKPQSPKVLQKAAGCVSLQQAIDRCSSAHLSMEVVPASAQYVAALAARASRPGGLPSHRWNCSERRNTDGPSDIGAVRRPDIAIQEVQVVLLLVSMAMWMGLQHVVPRRCLVAHASEGHQTPVGLQHVVSRRCLVATPVAIPLAPIGRILDFCVAIPLAPIGRILDFCVIHTSDIPGGAEA